MLAEAAGISKALVFHHFGSKKELYLSILADCVQLARERLSLQVLPQGLDFFAAMLEFARLKIAFFRDNPDVYRLIMEAAHSPSAEVAGEIAVQYPEMQSWKGTGWMAWFDRVPLRQGIDRQHAFELITMIITHHAQAFLQDVADMAEFTAADEEQALARLQLFLGMIRWGIVQKEEVDERN
jgi:TetR/AcrR family transcriptional regulator